MSSESRSKPIAFIGLGAMGLPMATRLLRAGYQVVGYDTSAAATIAFTEAGGDSAASAAAAVRGARAIVVMLPDSTVVEAVLRDPALRDALGADAIVVDMSSSNPLSTRQLAPELAELGIHMIDAPVSGGVSRAVDGTLTIMAGGPSDVIEDMRPILSHIGKTQVAGGIGAGHATKAINNLLSATHLLATAEAMITGQKLGLDPKALLAIINTSSGRSGSTENKWPNFVLTGAYNSGFRLRLMLKDMRIALSLAEETGTPHGLSTLATSLWGEAAEELPPDADHTEIALWLQDLAERDTSNQEGTER